MKSCSAILHTIFELRVIASPIADVNLALPNFGNFSFHEALLNTLELVAGWSKTVICSFINGTRTHKLAPTSGGALKYIDPEPVL